LVIRRRGSWRGWKALRTGVIVRVTLAVKIVEICLLQRAIFVCAKMAPRTLQKRTVRGDTPLRTPPWVILRCRDLQANRTANRVTLTVKRLVRLRIP